jgi:IPT/TIG domain
MKDRRWNRFSWAGSALALTLLIGAIPACGDEGGDLAITDVDPRTGGLAGEQPVRILGANFRPDIGYRVYFGERRATSVTVIDEETLLATTPEREESARVDVTILADNGPAFRVAQAYEYREQTAAEEAAQKNKGNLAY